jgi:hypothetical protein
VPLHAFAERGEAGVPRRIIVGEVAELLSDVIVMLVLSLLRRARSSGSASAGSRRVHVMCHGRRSRTRWAEHLAHPECDAQPRLMSCSRTPPSPSCDRFAGALSAAISGK